MLERLNRKLILGLALSIQLMFSPIVCAIDEPVEDSKGKESQGVDFTRILPIEVTTLIFSHVMDRSVRDLAQLREVSARCRSIVDSEAFIDASTRVKELRQLTKRLRKLRRAPRKNTDVSGSKIEGTLIDIYNKYKKLIGLAPGADTKPLPEEVVNCLGSCREAFYRALMGNVRIILHRKIKSSLPSMVISFGPCIATHILESGDSLPCFVYKGFLAFLNKVVDQAAREDTYSIGVTVSWGCTHSRSANNSSVPSKAVMGTPIALGNCLTHPTLSKVHVILASITRNLPEGLVDDFMKLQEKFYEKIPDARNRFIGLVGFAEGPLKWESIRKCFHHVFPSDKLPLINDTTVAIAAALARRADVDDETLNAIHSSCIKDSNELDRRSQYLILQALSEGPHILRLEDTLYQKCKDFYEASDDTGQHLHFCHGLCGFASNTRSSEYILQEILILAKEQTCKYCQARLILSLTHNNRLTFEMVNNVWRVAQPLYEEFESQGPSQKRLLVDILLKLSSHSQLNSDTIQEIFNTLKILFQKTELNNEGGCLHGALCNLASNRSTSEDVLEEILEMVKTLGCRGCSFRILGSLCKNENIPVEMIKGIWEYTKQLYGAIQEEGSDTDYFILFELVKGKKTPPEVLEDIFESAQKWIGEDKLFSDLMNCLSKREDLSAGFWQQVDACYNQFLNLRK